MTKVYSIDGITPVVHPSAYVHPSAVLIGDVIVDYAEVGESAIVAALAFVKARMVVPPRTLVAGIPGRVVRKLTRTELDWKIQGTDMYKMLTVRSLGTLRRTTARTKVEARRRRFDLPETLSLGAYRRKLTP